MSKSQRTKKDSLKKNKNPKNRSQLIDYDYLDKLNEEEIDFLIKFTNESIHANFSNKKERLHPKKRKSINKKLFYDWYKQEASDNNNARNRDIMSKFKKKDCENNEKLKETIEDIIFKNQTKQSLSVEDKIIEKIDEES